MNFVEYPDADMMMIDVANHIAGELNEHLMVNGKASFAVPGGSTPGPVFDVLSAADLDWSQVLVLPTDERWVPEDDAGSNARLIRERLLVGRASAAQFFSFYQDGTTPEAHCDALAARLQHQLPLSVLVLGMGADMHTASLFPIKAVDADYRHGTNPIFAPVKMPGLGKLGTRVTLTEEALNGAMSKHVLITGAEKRDALQRAIKIGDPAIAPIAGVLSGATVHWSES